jgi:hypothetical protein
MAIGFAVPPLNEAIRRYNSAPSTSVHLNSTGEETFEALFAGARRNGGRVGQLANPYVAHPAAQTSRAAIRSFMDVPASMYAIPRIC